MDSASLDLLKRIDAQLLAVTMPTREVCDAGPFRLMIDPSTDMIFMNYAVPIRSEFTEEAVREMVSAFDRMGRKPRLEFRRELWPELSAALEAEGFELEADLPMMTCTHATFIAATGKEVEVEILGPTGDLEALCRVADEAFGMQEPVTPERIAKVLANIESGIWVCALGKLDGEVAGCAVITPHEGVCELAGVGTTSAFRRRGVASAVSSRLLESHFETGDLAWLSAGDDVAKAVYERLGFQVAATQANYILRM